MQSRRNLLRFAASTATATTLLGATAGGTAAALTPEKPPMRWKPAHESNYTPADRDASDIRWIVLHTIEGSASAGINWFQNPDANVSSHFVVDDDGDITKMVNLDDVAWTQGNGPYNDTGISIELAGYAGETDFSEATYEAVADLCAYLCETYDVPVRHPTFDVAPCSAYDGDGGLVGHSQIPSPYDCDDVTGGKTDPGATWNWNYLLEKMNGSTGGGDAGGSYGTGQDVVSTTTVNVRASAEIADNVKHTQPTDVEGTIANGPYQNDGYTWWWVEWENDVGGWSVQDYLDPRNDDGDGDGNDGGDDESGDAPDPAFDIGEAVATTTDLNVRQEATTSADVVGIADADTTGYVKNGYVTNDGYTWWKIDYGQTRGWSAQSFLEPASDDGGDGTGNPIQGVPYLSQRDNDYSPSGSCQNTCLSMLFRHYGLDTDPDALTERWGTDDGQTPAGAERVFDQVASENGLDVRASGSRETTMADLEAAIDRGVPVMTYGWFTGAGHIVVAVGYTADTITVHDPYGTWNERYEGSHTPAAAATSPTTATRSNKLSAPTATSGRSSQNRERRRSSVFGPGLSQSLRPGHPTSSRGSRTQASPSASSRRSPSTSTPAGG
ncbi:N-acetylmuramoyl-L-alanine amidase [Halorubellus litoreus]|uniref:N-acetylmuramoyl-L-alanine amidase n=1 Tax=Halorubellus litoreus TaxID=755308 RepID=A0ABD5VHI9_9EURY